MSEKTSKVCEFATEEQKNAWWPKLCKEYDDYVVLAKNSEHQYVVPVEMPATNSEHQLKSRWRRRILTRSKHERIISIYAESKGCAIIADPSDRNKRCKKLFIQVAEAKKPLPKKVPKHNHHEPIGVWRARKELSHETRVRRARKELGLTG